jgi:hypothetical protein
MRRPLSGSLEHLAPPALLRLVSATSPSGVLELKTEVGSLRLEVKRGCVAVPTTEELEEAGRILACRSGDFRFAPGQVGELECDALTLTAFADAAGAAASDLKLGNLLDGDVLEAPPPIPDSNLHFLPSEALPNPLDDLLADLESGVLEELLLSQIGVFAQDPRWWKGSLERDWQRRGWKVCHFPSLESVDLDGLDVLVVHHQQGTVRVGREQAWLDLIAAAEGADPPVPVVWIAQLGDPEWVHRLIESGVSFLIPAPQGEGGEAVARLGEDVSRVVGRQLRKPLQDGPADLTSEVAELVGALLSQSDPDQGVSSLLQLASREFDRGAVLRAEETSVRCRAGFGYNLNREKTALPRGIGFLERVLRAGEALTEIDPESSGACHLAEILGVEVLPAATAVLPLGRSGGVVGVLVADRKGGELPDLADLVHLVGRLGGALGP